MHNFLIINLVVILISSFSYADDVAIDHGPINVMGDHFHEKGEWMFSMRVMKMTMQDNILNGTKISDTEILERHNPFSSMPNMPMKLSIIPKEMKMDMIMLGAMYAPLENLTLMGMAMFNEKEMTLNTHKGMMLREYLGSFKTSTSDLSDIALMGLYKLYQTPQIRWHLHFGFEKGIGDNSKIGNVLTPMNMRTSITLPYAMQSSDHSLRIVSGITKVLKFGDYVFGNQLLFNFKIKEEDWFFGNRWDFNTWIQGAHNDKFSYSVRLHYKNEGTIGGRNNSIMAPVQTADTDNYGGKTLNLGLGVNTVFHLFGGSYRDRFGFELVLPLIQDINGLQMENKFSFTIGYQRSFP